MLVSRKWRAMGGDPSLWKWFRFIVRSRDDINHLSITRLRDIEEICIYPGDNWLDDDWGAVFQAGIGLQSLKKIDGLYFVNFSSVEPELFARGLTSLEDVDLRYSNITNNQQEELFKAMWQNYSCLITSTCVNVVVYKLKVSKNSVLFGNGAKEDIGIVNMWNSLL